jgi:hypothetical protein
MEHSLLMLLQSALFITTWRLIHVRVSTKGAFPVARKINKIHSRIYSIVSLFLCYLALSPHYRNSEIARQLYHVSKFYEYIDILTVRAGGSQIDLHFGFHHLTTPYLTYFRVLKDARAGGDDDGWWIFAALNTAHHALMYAYFGGTSFVRPVLDFTGCVQLVVGIAVEAWVLRSRELGIFSAEGRPHVFAAALLGSYFCLWAREMRMRRIARQAQVKEKSL